MRFVAKIGINVDVSINCAVVRPASVWFYSIWGMKKDKGQSIAEFGLWIVELKGKGLNVRSIG